MFGYFCISLWFPHKLKTRGKQSKLLKLEAFITLITHQYLIQRLLNFTSFYVPNSFFLFLFEDLETRHVPNHILLAQSEKHAMSQYCRNIGKSTQNHSYIHLKLTLKAYWELNKFMVPTKIWFCRCVQKNPQIVSLLLSHALKNNITITHLKQNAMKKYYK